MSKSEKRWRRLYLFLMIFIYAIFAPITVTEWLAGSGGFPYTAIVVGIALPFMRKNHLNSIRQKEHRESA
ncbi:hypothetical protein [Tenuibacillus multivorans]|uniref:Uncharacterized protein n=1 Tax=Tenuibacillus multivorans TaxID=237069 RepID=A0A1G9WIP2_9BACI|nr:hypothetical protein [Tenuibacillus multivorans]GEL76476.1 hypothetical protein TMU01_07110 [Tenuibacillus multivorans]SDM84227.1 hypothetical protein SAMN05216498_0763 [Tenuibacillus multivorans]